LSFASFYRLAHCAIFFLSNPCSDDSFNEVITRSIKSQRGADGIRFMYNENCLVDVIGPLMQ
jgi:hypothetical protein